MKRCFEALRDSGPKFQDAQMLSRLRETKHILQQMSAPFLQQAARSNELDRQQSRSKNASHAGSFAVQLT